MEKFEDRHRDDYFELLRDFEVKKKTIRPEIKDKVSFKIPIALLETYREVNGCDFSRSIMTKGELSQSITFTGDKLRIQAEQVKTLFKETCGQIVQHIKSIFRLPEVQSVETILMVGGFSESPMLQDAIKRGFSNKKVIIPLDAGLTVLKGAVIYGHHPTAIVSRVSKATYGVKKYSKFVPGLHEESRKVIIDGKAKCRGLFDKHVEIGQEVEEGTDFGERKYYPVSHRSTGVCVKVFTSMQKDPKYTDGCRQLGRIDVSLKHRRIVTTRDKKILVKMIYGGTELGVEVKVAKTGELLEAKYDFLS